MTYFLLRHYLFQVPYPSQALTYSTKIEDLAFLDLKAAQHSYAHNFHYSENVVVGSCKESIYNILYNYLLQV
jgi:hypothetical protein